ncbi:hypothetical protein VF_B0034 (plasmid) [Aliivibrio fischeri ES114]|uniref:Uncharacterized protein n=2 Tax=Aliivibrio fischeri TaxID=668 RepID=Q5DY70_ALIF1|nr:hypothetical protein VF_B0034 [Aliivibrio fischeri ES114]KLU77251.1 hypothetical protein AB192_18835 [Aliivibrio fischeri]
MKMKKTLLATVLFGCVLSGSVFAEKVTYDKAVADAQAYHDSLPQYENAIEGLGPDETGSTTAGANQMGKWVNLGASSIKSAGAYTTMLAPSAIGKSCIKGDRGWISKTREECIIFNGGSTSCRKYRTELDAENGYKAECR